MWGFNSVRNEATFGLRFLFLLQKSKASSWIVCGLRVCSCLVRDVKIVAVEARCQLVLRKRQCHVERCHRKRSSQALRFRFRSCDAVWSIARRFWRFSGQSYSFRGLDVAWLKAFVFSTMISLPSSSPRRMREEEFRSACDSLRVSRLHKSLVVSIATSTIGGFQFHSYHFSNSVVSNSQSFSSLHFLSLFQCVPFLLKEANFFAQNG